MARSRFFSHLDYRMLGILFALMIISLLIITATDPSLSEHHGVLSPKALSQLHRFIVGIGVFLLFAWIDYRRLREWAWIAYLLTVIALFGLFFTDSIQNVQRWYRIPGIGASLQPSECAKLVLVIALSWYLERTSSAPHTRTRAFLAMMIVAIPFLLIYKQPDLGTSLILCPIAYAMFYLGNLHPWLLRLLGIMGGGALIFVLSIFLGLLPIETIKPTLAKVLKEYQLERLDPNTHHQRAAITAIGCGGITGSGWCASEFTGRGWLPFAHTDSVFPAFAEEFGLIGEIALLGLFYCLIHFGFEVVTGAKDAFGRLLAAGITSLLAIHLIINVGMMCGLLPITGVPLPLISYGGSSIFVTMAALGILQSIHSRRFMF